MGYDNKTVLHESVVPRGEDNFLRTPPWKRNDEGDNQELQF